MAFLNDDELDALSVQQAHTASVLNNPPPPQPQFSPWGSGAGAMIGAGNLSGDLNGDGLDDTTGWAVGVTQDSSSPTGFSYNGTPTYSNGGLYTPSATPPATFGPAGPSEPFFSPWDTGAGTMIGAGNAIDPGAAAMARGDIGAYYEGLDEYLKNGINSPNLSPDWLEANQELIDPSYNPTSAGYNNWGLWNQNPPPIFSPQDARYALNYGGGQDQYLAPFTTPSDYGEPYNSLPGQGSFSVDPNAILDPSQTNYLSDSGETKPFYWPRWVPHLLGDTGPTQPTTGGIDYQTGHDLLNYGQAAQGADYFRPNWDIFNQPEMNPNDPYAAYRDINGNVNGVVDPYDPRINPETARESVYGSASNGGNPITTVLQGGLEAANVPFAGQIARGITPLTYLIPGIGPALGAAGEGAGGGATSGPGLLADIGNVAMNAGFSGVGPIAKNAAAILAGNLAGEGATTGLQKYGESNLAGADIAANPWVQTGVGLGAGVLAGGTAYHFTPENPAGILRQGAERVGLTPRNIIQGEYGGSGAVRGGPPEEPNLRVYGSGKNRSVSFDYEYAPGAQVSVGDVVDTPFGRLQVERTFPSQTKIEGKFIESPSSPTPRPTDSVTVTRSSAPERLAAAPSPASRPEWNPAVADQMQANNEMWARIQDDSRYASAKRDLANAQNVGDTVRASYARRAMKAVEDEYRSPSILGRLNDETGALDMGAIGDMANATRRSLPGRAVAKVTPGGFEVTPGAAEGGTRIGDLLHAPTGEALGPNYTPQQVLRVERTLTRRAGSVANTLEAEAAPYWNRLGRTFKGEDGNVYLRDVKPSQAEVDAGLPGALAVRVVERPNEYALTTAQRNAVDKLGEITQRVTNEKVALGYDQRTVQLDEGDIYQHRVVLKPSTAKQAEGLVSSTARTPELTPPGGGGSRLSIGTDKTRLYDDPVQAVKDGVVYDNPKNAMAANIDSGLRKAVNTHVKNLLEPFGQTSADRVSPELRAQVEGIRQRIQSLKDTGTRLGDRTDRVIDRFLADPGANLDDLRDALPVRVGANAVGKQGVNFGKTRQELNQTLLGLRKDLNDVAPQWRKEIAASRSPLPGRRTIPMEIAPALAGRDFDRTTAARIISHYGGGIRVGDRVMETKIPFVKGINAILTPVNATADFSVTLNQLAMTAASHPVQFAKNLVLSMKDMFDNAGYQRWLASTRASDAAKYVTIHGQAGPESDFLSKALRRFPVVGQTQKQFERFGNRMRVDAFNAVADSAAKSAKRPLDDLAKEQIGKAIDRVTGVSTTRASDLERTVQFAPNFFRSIIETTAHAAMDGSLEGQVARQYLKNYAALGAGLVTAAALQQNRDPRDVLSPFDMKAWQKGEIRLNPNWMTVRVAGQDIKVFGTYDSAIKLLVTGADAGYRSVDQKDASQLFDFLGYAASTKGSPVAKFITDLIKGETFTHENPYSPTSLATRLLPISAQTAVQDYQKGMSAKEIAADVGLSVIGAKSSPVTDYEKRQQQVIDAGFKDANGNPITRWEDLSYEQQNQLKAAGGAAGSYQTQNPTAIQSAKARALAQEELAREQTKIDNKYLTDGKPNSYQDGKDWRDQYHAQQFAARVAYNTLEKEHPFTGDPNTEPQHAAVDEYFKLMDEVSVGSKVDWDALDKWRYDNPEKAALVDAYFSDPNRKTSDLTPGITAYKAASKVIGDSGFFDLGSYDWEQVKKAAPDAAGFASYDDYRNAVLENWTKQYIAQGIDPVKAKDKASSAFSDTAIAKAEKAAQAADNGTQTTWMLANPDAAVQAWRWGYFVPQKTVIGTNGLPKGVSELQWLTDYINRTGQ